MDMLIEGEVAPNDRDRPARWKQGSLELALSYRFDPGSAADGVTVHIPLASLGAVRETNFEWLVPAFRSELVVALLRTLPKRLRTPLVPIPDTATALLAAVTPRSGPLLEVLAEAIERAARRAHRPRRLVTRRSARAPADDLQRRGRGRDGARVGPVARRAAR